MTLRPMYVTCKDCGKKYSFNPDVGKGLYCPYCNRFGRKKILDWLKKKAKEKQ